MDGGGQQAAAAERSCGTCTMCCKLIEITEINKPQNAWCAQCKPGKGCGIYDSRPNECAGFFCGWLGDPALGDEWRPDRAKFIITFEPGTGRIFIVCDANAPTAWRREPYYTNIRKSLLLPGAERKQIVVQTGRKVTLLVRGGEFDLGDWNKGDQISITYGPSDKVTKAVLVKEQREKIA